MATDRYAGFAQRYDAFFGSFDVHDGYREAFFKQLFERHNVRSVLDCACGTGRDLLLFHRLGLEVHGSDISPSMLAQAERNMAAHRFDVPLLQSDFRELPLTYVRGFDAVVCMSSAYLELPDAHELARSFSSMRGVLNEGGILIVSSGISDKLWTEKPRFIPEINNDAFTRLFVIDYLREGATFNVVDLYHHPQRKEILVWSITYRQVYLQNDLETAIHRAGFLTDEYYGGYQFEPYDTHTSDMLIAVAVR